MSAEPDLARATELLRRGALAEAEQGLRSFLAGNPRHAEATHLLALARKQAGDLPAALDLMRASIAVAPRRPEFHANLGNLLRGLGRGAEAESAYRNSLTLDPGFRLARLGLARLLTDLSRAEEAEAEARELLGRDRRDAEAWAALAAALAARQLDTDAEAAYREALQLRPAYGVARHNLGSLLARQQRAEEAIVELDRALADGARGREIHFNRGRALFDLYRFDEAEAALESAVTAAPLDTESHQFLAKLRYMRGEPAFVRSLETAIGQFPQQLALRLLLADLLRRAGQAERSERELLALAALGQDGPGVWSALGTVLQDQGRFVEAEHYARRAIDAKPEDPGLIENHVVLLLALGRAAETLPLITTAQARYPLDQRWLAHQAIAARLLGQPDYERMYDYPRFVRPFDLPVPPGWSTLQSFHADLLPLLASRHRLAAHPLDQSLRGGTQTARSLLADPDPVLQALLASLRAAIAEYQGAIGYDAAHPYLARNRSEARMAGCWSVRLQRGGYHVNHIHPAGWISSAYYADVPTEVLDTRQRSGWIKFGEPNVATPGADPAHFVQPRAGRLVLFPSYMWHGTVAIQGDEPRMTVAFDAVPA